VTGVQVSDDSDDALFGIKAVPASVPAPAAPPVTPVGGTGVNASGSAQNQQSTKVVSIGAVIQRADLTKEDSASGVALTDGNLKLDPENKDFEHNLALLLNHNLALSIHDRRMAIALAKVHLERGEELDKLPITVGVASVISDNTGAVLKALELSQRAGERVHKVAELLVTAKKNDEATLLAAAKLRKENAGADEWGSDPP
jgi:hypothetical protein